VIRVLLVDDQPLIRVGLRGILELEDDIEVVGEAPSGRQALAVLSTTPVDVVLMDIRMPDLDGIETTTAICADPRYADVRVLVLTTFETDEHVVAALQAGASGFLGKGAEPEAVVDAVRVIAQGEALLSPTATRSLIERFLAKAAAPDRTLRYASALELSADIERFLGGEPVFAYRETVLERLVRLILHNQALVLLVAAYLLMRIALFFFVRH